MTNYEDTNYNVFNASELEENFFFNDTVSDDSNNTYNVICRFWKPADDKMRIFCKLNERLLFISFLLFGISILSLL